MRAWVAGLLADLAEDDLLDVQLVVVELVTNAIEHGGGPRWIRLTRGREPRQLRIEVQDSNLDRLTPGASRFGASAYRGRGLMLVGRMSQSWGVHRDESSGQKTVWTALSFRTPASSASPAGAAHDTGTDTGTGAGRPSEAAGPSREAVR